jgi:hypothetical protein
MEIRVSYIGRDYARLSNLPSVLHLEKGATLGRATDAIARQTDPDILLSPNSLVEVNGNHAGTLAAPDHRNLRDGDEICITIS